MRCWRSHVIVVAFLASPLLPRGALADPLNLDSQSGLTFDFYPSSSAYMLDGDRDSYDGCYYLTINGTAFNAGNRVYDDYYSGRGFRTQAHAIGNLTVRRYGFVPESGLSFGRYIDSVENGGAQTAIVTFSYSCNVGSDFATIVVATSDGDALIETADDWSVTDDEDDGGDASLAHVLLQTGSDIGLQAISLQWNDSMTWSYEVTIPAGDTAAIMFFAVQERSRALAQAAAESLAALDAEAIDALGEEGDHVVNFPVGVPGAPRLISNGPYRVNEGEQVDLDIDVVDDDGNVSFSWDMNDDGIFGDHLDDPTVTVDAADADGPSSLRVGVEVTDTTNDITAQRRISIYVDNLAPVVTSEPPTEATTGVEYTYQIQTTDIPDDELTYTIDEGPAGMTVSSSGLVRWTPEPDGQGPTVPFTITVSDDDGGQIEQSVMLTMGGAPTVVPAGPYRVAEGDEILLEPTVEDPEGDPMTFAWDLDGDGAFDDETERSATWSAAGIDGPADGFVVRMRVSDGTHEVRAQIPISVQNAPPVFLSQPSGVAVVNREWTYVIQTMDPGDDDVTITVGEEELPQGMVFLEDPPTLTYTPNAGALTLGQPAGHYEFTITADDDDRGHARQEVQITVGENSPPPVPPIKYPNGEVVHTAQPTIILENVDDPEGDPVQYFLDTDYDTCFCSVEHQASPALAPGELVTEWPLPRPFNVDPDDGGHSTFYVRRWSGDGLAESAREISLFTYEPGDDPDPDAGIDSGEGSESATCARCSAGSPANAASSLAVGALVMVLLGRRRRR